MFLACVVFKDIATLHMGGGSTAWEEGAKFVIKF